MTEQTVGNPSRRKFSFQQEAISIAAAVLLGVTAVLTAWSAYRGSEARDYAMENWINYTSYVSQSSSVFQRASMDGYFEVDLWREWAVLTLGEQSSAADFMIENVMPPEVANAVKWWLDNQSASSTPFTEENPYLEDLMSEKRYERHSELMEQGNSTRDSAFFWQYVAGQFGLANVFFAIVLFLAGVATLVRQRVAQVTFLVVGVIGLIAGAVVLYQTPMLFSFHPPYFV